MKISTKGRYGLRILMDLAIHQSEKPRLIRDIAQSQQISEKYISRLVISLRKAGMIRSVRGVNGGFHLDRKPEDITPMMLFLADEEKSGFITGQTFVIDGGQSIDGGIDSMLESYEK